ncbi:MAG TPA: MarR family transcriptional regulator [Alphaproteobacteria bacterium]|nr:MarR family transcriptional regulator [Alphaproteobacteria bacterium]
MTAARAEAAASSARPRRPASAARAGERYVLDAQVGFLLRKAQQRATAIFLRQFGAHQLTPTQWAALAKLRQEGSLSQNRLGRLTAMDPATIQGVIRRLAARGLIAHLPDPKDRRRKSLALTQAGATLVERLVAAAVAVSAETLKPLAAEERKRLLDLLARLG